MRVRIKAEVCCSGKGCSESFETELDLSWFLPSREQNYGGGKYPLKIFSPHEAEKPPIPQALKGTGWIWSRGEFYCPQCAPAEQKLIKVLNRTSICG